MKLEYETYKQVVFDLRERKNVTLKKKIAEKEILVKETLTTKANQKKIKVLKEEVEILKEAVKKMTMRDIFANINKDDGLKSLLPNMLVLLKLGILCPVGNSVVERLFSLMKLVKTPLRNLLSKSLDIFYYKICIFLRK